MGCPVCRTACEARDLVPNVVVRDVVGAWEDVEKAVREVEEANEANEANEVGGSWGDRGDRDGHVGDGGGGRRKKRRKGGGGRVDDVEVEVVCLSDSDDDEDDDDGEGSSGSGLPSPSAQSSGEEYRPGKKKDRNVATRKNSRPSKKNKPPPAQHNETQSSFLPCPICGRNVHHMYMNSHVDACLANGGAADVKDANTNANTNANDAVAAVTAPQALPVPPKLVLVGGFSHPQCEKRVKEALRRFHVPVDGCGSARELFDRYVRFRTAVEVSNDRGEVGASYEKVVFRLMKEERSKKMAGMFAAGERRKGTTDRAGAGAGAGAGAREVATIDLVDRSAVKEAVGGRRRSAGPGDGNAAGLGVTLARVRAARAALAARYPDLEQVRHPREIVLEDDASFEEMVEVTRLRDRVRAKLLGEFGGPVRIQEEGKKEEGEAEVHEALELFT